MEEWLAALGRCPLFAGLDRPTLSRLLPQLQPIPRRRAQGEALLLPGETAPGVGVLLTGGLRIVREDFWGNRSLLTTLGPGDLFAEAFACSGVPVTVRAEAAQAAEAVFFPPSRLLAPPPEGRELPGRLLKVFAQKNVMLNRKIDHLSQRTTRAKVLSYLSHQASEAGSSSFTIPLNRQELADYLSVDRSALSAELGKLRREGVLEFHRSQFLLRQLPQT
mgnify:FL=1